MNDDFREALAAIEGIEQAEIDAADDGPLGIRVRLARDADRRLVAEAVQRLLESHGLRSRVAPDRRRPGPLTPPAPPPEGGRPLPPSGPEPAPGPPITAEDVPAAVTRGGPAPTISDVTISETTEGITVTVSVVGRGTAIRRARPTEPALHEAIVSAVSELANPDAPPTGLRALERSEAFSALTVYLEGPDGRVRVGAALVAAGHPFALAQAVWSALEG